MVTPTRPVALAAVLVAAACAGGPSHAPPLSPGSAHAGGPYDVVIEGGRIVDGTGNAWYPGDLGIRDGRPLLTFLHVF